MPQFNKTKTVDDVLVLNVVKYADGARGDKGHTEDELAGKKVVDGSRIVVVRLHSSPNMCLLLHIRGNIILSQRALWRP